MAANTVAEPGTIGQVYEHRKTHKIGVLESRETKYKTLMFRDKNGGSFTTTYSTFRSDWRKYAGDEVIQTSTQAEEKKPEKKPAEKPVKEKSEKKPDKKKENREEIEALTEETKNLVTAILEKAKKDLVVKIGGHGGKMNCVRVKNGRKNLFEIWLHKEAFEFFTNKELWDAMEFPEKFGDVKAEIHENFNLKYKAVFNEKALQAVIKIAVAAV